MNLIYLEQVFLRYGDQAFDKAEIDATTFAMLLTLAADNSKESKAFFKELDGEIDEAFGDEWLFGVDYLILGLQWYPARTVANARNVLKALNTKGYFSEQWEEGVFAICQKDKLQEAKLAIARRAASGDDDDPFEDL